MTHLTGGKAPKSDEMREQDASERSFDAFRGCLVDVLVGLGLCL